MRQGHIIISDNTDNADILFKLPRFFFVQPHSCGNNPHLTDIPWLRRYSQINMYHLEAENVQKIKKGTLEVYDLENVFLVEVDVLSAIEKRLHWADWKRLFIRHCLCWWTVKCASTWKINLCQISIWSTMFCEDASEKKREENIIGTACISRGDAQTGL